MDVRTALAGLKRDLNDFSDETNFLAQTVNDFANKLQNQSGKSGKSRRRVGIYIAAGGGVLCAAGIGLSFVTLGGSIGVILAGGILCGIGGATNSFTGKNSTLQASQNTQKDVLVGAVENYNNLLNKIKEKCLQIGRELETYGNIEYLFPQWCDFWCRFWNSILFAGQSSQDKTQKWSDIVQTVRNSQRTKKGMLMKTTMKNMHVDVTGIDVDYLLDALENVQRKSINKMVRSVTDFARTLENTCPSKADITTMIQDTLAGV